MTGRPDGSSRPPKEVLRDLALRMTAVEIGKVYDVAPKTASNWCRLAGILPCRPCRRGNHIAPSAKFSHPCAQSCMDCLDKPDPIRHRDKAETPWLDDFEREWSRKALAFNAEDINGYRRGMNWGRYEIEG